MKMTLEIAAPLLRLAKAAAAERGISLGELVSEALAGKLRAGGGAGKPWMKGFGKLRGLHTETVRIDRIIEKEFGRIEAEEWR